MDNYANMTTALQKWLNREGFTSLTDQTDDLLAIAQRRIERECDLKAMMAVTTLAVNAQTIAAPADLLRVRSMSFDEGTGTQEIVGAPLGQVLRYGSTAAPTRYAVVGTNFYFGPAPDQEYTVTLIYFTSMGVLTSGNTTNWLTDNAPEFLLWAAMLEACLFLKDDARAQVWEGRYTQIKGEVMKAEERMDKESGSLRVRNL